MHPPTLIAILSLHLVCFGILGYLIACRLPSTRGMREWAAGSILYGLAYGGRMQFSNDTVSLMIVPFDAAMVAAVVLYVTALIKFFGRDMPSWPWLLASVLMFAVTDFMALTVFGAVGRNALFNFTMSSLLGLLAVSSGQHARYEASSQRAPLLLLTVLVGGLSAQFLGRSYIVATEGVAAIYNGPLVQIFFSYVSIVVVLIAMIVIWMAFVRVTSQLEELAARDFLTKALNRKGLDEVLVRHFGARNAAPLVLIEVDIDYFKRINDTWGHAVGDTTLCAITRQLECGIRGNDFVARIGGEEFLVGCVGADATEVQALAERLRAAIETMDIALPNGAILRCTASFGVSRPFLALNAWQAAFEEADSALYAAKAAGRNRVVVATAAAP